MSTPTVRGARSRCGAVLLLAFAMVTLQLLVRPAVRASASTGASTLASAAGGPKYTVEDLGVFTDGGGATYATGINAAGDVSGFGNHASAAYTAFRWHGGTLTDLGDLGCGSRGNAINDSGTVVGYSNVTCAESDKAGFQTTSGGLEEVGSLFARPTIANAINTSGQIVGSSVTDHGTGRAFITGPGGIGSQQVDLLATSEPPGAQTLEAHGVNNSGDVVGIAFFFDQTCGSYDAPFLFSGSTIQSLNLLGGCSGQANAINDSGVVVGFEGVATGGSHAFSYDGTIHDLGAPSGTTISQALAVNSGGTIVGSAQACNICPQVAWVQGTTGGMQLLNDLIDPSLGWNLQSAAAINDSGQIAGTGAINGTTHAFRLTPIVPKTLTGITVMPSAPTIPKGARQQFTATGTYSDGSTADLTSTVTWASTNHRVATIDSGGLLTTLVRGTTTVTATAGPVSGSTGVTVGPKVLVSLSLSPSNPAVAAGATVQFTATATYTDATTLDVTTKGTWRSATLKVATIDVHTGLATAKKNGTTTITLHYSGLPPASTTLTVGGITGF
jgi:probable HAF family extracellular repeat protein